MPRLDDFSESEVSDVSELELLTAVSDGEGVPVQADVIVGPVGPVSAAVVEAPGVGERKRALNKVSCGAGRWGSSVERHLVGSRMREGKARKRAKVLEENLEVAKDNYAGVVMQRPKTGGNSIARRCSLPTMLQIGFESQHATQTLAGIHGLSEAHVRTIRGFVAAVYLNCQLLIIGCLVARAHLEAPTFVGMRLAWDETGQRVTVRQKQVNERSVWQIMVVRVKLMVAWAQESYVFDVVFPPLLVKSVAAASIFAGLYLHPLTAPIWRGINYLMMQAEFAVSFAETDAAAANLKMGAVILDNAAKGQFHGHWLCSLHQAQLCEVSVTTSLTSLKVMSRLYSLSLLLESGGLFARLKTCARILAQDELMYIRGQAPENARPFAREMCHYMITHYFRFAVTANSRQKKHHWLNSVSLDGDNEADIADFDIFRSEHPKIKHKEQYQLLSLGSSYV